MEESKREGGQLIINARAIVEVSWGIGNIVKVIPLLNAARTYGIKVDVLWVPDYYPAASSLVDNVLLCENIYVGQDGKKEVIDRIKNGMYNFGLSCYYSRYLLNEQEVTDKIPIYYNKSGLEEQEDVANIKLLLKAIIDITGKQMEISVPRELTFNIRVFNELNKYRDYVIICPGAKKGWELKLYGHWKEVIDILVGKGHKVAILGDGLDLERNPWMSDYELITVDIDRAFYIAMICKYMISTDTGLAQLRALDGRHQMMIFGPTLVNKNIPVSNNCLILRNEEVDCIPCQGKPDFANCKLNKCMDIGPEVVADMAIRILSGDGLVPKEAPKKKVEKSPDQSEINVNKNYMEF